MKPDELDQTWRSLQGARVAIGDFRVWESEVRSEVGAILVALDSAGNRHLLVPVLTRPGEDRASRGVQLVRRELLDEEQPRLFLDVACRVPELGELFATLASEMLGGILVAPGNPAKACQRVLDRWRDLLDRERLGVLSTERLAGLFAELWYLRYLAGIDPARALDSWVAPRGEPHDFRSGLRALEVKATLAREGRLVEVHGVGQLEPPSAGSLHNALIVLERVDSGGESVPLLIRSIRELGMDQQRLSHGLHTSGYDHRDEEVYRPIEFALRERRIYLVDDQFPRIIPASFLGGQLPPGVLRLHYQVDLTGEPPMPLSAAEEQVAITALVA